MYNDKRKDAIIENSGECPPMLAVEDDGAVHHITKGWAPGPDNITLKENETMCEM